MGAEARAQRKAAPRLGWEERLLAQKAAVESAKRPQAGAPVQVPNLTTAVDVGKVAQQQKSDARESTRQDSIEEIIVDKKDGADNRFALSIAQEERRLSCRRTSWDLNWEHPCAGGKRSDGSAIFCGPCDTWISVNDPFDHRGFELHCS